jgi:hypothetical protein
MLFSSLVRLIMALTLRVWRDPRRSFPADRLRVEFKIRQIITETDNID